MSQRNNFDDEDFNNDEVINLIMQFMNDGNKMNVEISFSVSTN